MRGDEAKEKCPAIQLVQVEEARGKANLSKYRAAGVEVIEVLSRFSSCVERASIDEAYIDLTQEVGKRLADLGEGEIITANQLPNTFIQGWKPDSDKIEEDAGREMGVSDWLGSVFDPENDDPQQRALAMGAMVAEEMRAAVYAETGFRCSAGIGHNKMLAKLVCGFHKPNKQTVIPQSSVPAMFNCMPLRKVRNFGGKMGAAIMEKYAIENMGELCAVEEADLKKSFGDKTGKWLYQICRGIDHEPVSPRQLPKSIGCSKNFMGKECLDTKKKVQHWLQQLGSEVVERLEKDRIDNKRVAKTMTVSLSYVCRPQPVLVSRSFAIVRYDAGKLISDAFSLLLQFNTGNPAQGAWTPPLIHLGVSASKFLEEGTSVTPGIAGYLAKKGDNSLVGSSQLPSSQLHVPSSSSKLGNAKKVKRGSIENFLQMNSENSSGKLNACDKDSPDIIDITEEKRPHVDSSNSSSSLTGNKRLGFFASVQVSENTNASKVYLGESTKSEEKTCMMSSNENSNCSQVEFKNGNDDFEIIRSGEKPTVSLEERTTKITCGENATDDECVELKRAISLHNEDQQNSALPESTQKGVGTLDTDTSDLTRCDKCATLIPAWELPEHLDFHFALELSEQEASPAVRLENRCKNLAKKRMSDTPITSSHSDKKAKYAKGVTSLHSFFKSK
ncbi:DNA polymerase eta-like isoform X2 [Liolophura sinensis]